MKRKQLSAAPDLKADTIAVLLAGWGAPEPPEPYPHGFSGGFLQLLTPGGIAEVWNQHGPWLRERARAWGWEPTIELDGELVFYGEYVCRTGNDGTLPSQ